jgi:hypothetical protein
MAHSGSTCEFVWGVGTLGSDFDEAMEGIWGSKVGYTTAVKGVCNL